MLLENLVRYLDNETVVEEDIKALVEWQKQHMHHVKLLIDTCKGAYARFYRVPAVVDLAAMREAVKSLGGKVDKVNPLSPVDLVIDHSVMVDDMPDKNAFAENVEMKWSVTITLPFLTLGAAIL